MLHQRVSVVRDYLVSVRAGELPANAALLRQAASLCQRLPLSGPADHDLRASFMRVCFTRPLCCSSWLAYPGCAARRQETNDALLLAYLATITKGCGAVADEMAKFSKIHENQGQQRGGAGGGAGAGHRPARIFG
jgi:COP9 signalosome complex subunit 6